jgi:hypothetical protein
MWTSRFVKFAPASGIVFFILAVLGSVAMLADSPDFAGPPGEYATYFTDHADRITWGAVSTMTAVFFLLWFLGSLTSLLGVAEGGDRRVTSIARAGGVAGAGLLLASSAVSAVGGLRVDDQTSISDDLAAAYGDLSSAFVGLAAPYAFAVLLGATAVVSLRTGVLPMWLTWVSVVIAIGMLVPLISFAMMPVFALWVLIVSILLLLRSAGPIETKAD